MPGGVELYLAHLANLDPKWNVNGNSSTTYANIDAALGAAESDDTRLGRLRGVLSDEVAATRYREAFDRTRRFTTADIDRALAAAERDREERRRAATGRRVSRLERLLSAPGGGEAFTAALDAQAPSWRRTGTRPSDIDRALDAVERGRDPTSRRRGGIGWSSRRNGPFPAPRARRGGTRAPVSTSSPRPAGRPGACRRRSRTAPAPGRSPPSGPSRRRRAAW